VFWLVAFILVLSTPAGLPQTALPDRVDLRSSQTPFRDQKGRRTCIVHSFIAAMEADLKRSGRDVDLSEDRFMYGSVSWW
jgi:hypothetical protein